VQLRPKPRRLRQRSYRHQERRTRRRSNPRRRSPGLEPLRQRSRLWARHHPRRATPQLRSELKRQAPLPSLHTPRPQRRSHLPRPHGTVSRNRRLGAPLNPSPLDQRGRHPDRARTPSAATRQLENPYRSQPRPSPSGRPRLPFRTRRFALDLSRIPSPLGLLWGRPSGPHRHPRSETPRPRSGSRASAQLRLPTTRKPLRRIAWRLPLPRHHSGNRSP